MTVEIGENLANALVAFAIALAVVGAVWGFAWSTRGR